MSDLFWLSEAQVERLRPFFRRLAVSRVSMIGGC